MRRPRVRILVALKCEARPLVNCFGLKRRKASGSPLAEVFASDTMVVACCGVGKIAMARTVGWLHGVLGERRDAPWLNLGIAGGREIAPGVAAEFGDLALAAKVVDVAVQRANEELAQRERNSVQPPTSRPLPRARSVSLPPQLVRHDLPAAVVRTVDAVELDYADVGLFEMEAAGFLAAARSLSSAELIQVAKVVSDTPEHPVQALDVQSIEGLIEGRIEQIARLIERLHRLLPEDAIAGVESWRARLCSSGRWSFSQQQQLQKLLTRWAALRHDAPQPPSDLGDSRRTLEWLARQLEAQPPPLAAQHAGSQR